LHNGSKIFLKSLKAFGRGDSFVTLDLNRSAPRLEFEKMHILKKYINLTVQKILLLRLDAVEVGLILKHDKFTI
jgi:hypothetical protein